MPKSEIAAIGEILIDFIAEQEAPLEDVQSFRKFAGGAPANVVVGIRRLGIPVILISKVGNDAFGQFLIKSLQHEGVDTTYVLKDNEYHTGVVFVQLIGAQPEFILYSDVAYNNIKEDEIPKPLIQQLKVLHFGSVLFTQEPSRTAVFKTVEYARNFDVLITYDVNIRKDLWRGRIEDMWTDVLTGVKLSDIVKFSDSEILDLADELGIRDKKTDIVLDILFKLGPKLIIITKGAKGATFYQKLKRKIVVIDIPPYPVTPVDTTGAGDAFMAAVIAGIYGFMKTRGYPSLTKRYLYKLGRFAVIVAALSTLHKGAWSVPKIDTIKVKEISNILRNIKQVITKQDDAT